MKKKKVSRAPAQLCSQYNSVHKLHHHRQHPIVYSINRQKNIQVRAIHAVSASATFSGTINDDFSKIKWVKIQKS